MAVSCLDKPDCFRLSSDHIGVSFKVLGTNKADADTLKWIEIKGAGIITGPATPVSDFLIPLNYLVNQTDVNITGNKFNGNMLLKYLSQAQFVSDECGPRYILSALTVDQQSGFDSVRVVAGQVSNPPILNLEIFRCPTTNLVKLDFYQLYVAGNGKKTSQLLTLKVDTITTNYSSALFYLGATTNTVTLPVNINSGAGPGSSAFAISYGDKTNTASLTYTLTQEERYNVCPPKMYVSGLGVTSLDFDSVSIAVVDKKIMNAPQDPASTNVLIFQCPQTNLMRVAFKTGKGTSFVAASFKFNKITSNFSTDQYYVGTTTSSVELPVNESTSSVEYYFDFNVKEGDPALVDTLRVSYDAINKTIFNACGVQKVYDNLKATSPDFTFASPAIPKDSIQFPSITNIEILKN